MKRNSLGNILVNQLSIDDYKEELESVKTYGVRKSKTSKSKGKEKVELFCEFGITHSPESIDKHPPCHKKHRQLLEGTSTAFCTNMQKVVEFNPDVTFLKKLVEIRRSYTKSLSYFKHGDYDKTEEEIRKTLKPILSKSEATLLPSGYINQTASIVLDSLYHLGVIYLNSKKYIENYAKAAAIFKYCQNFYEKYKPELQVNDGKIDPTHFGLFALSIERLFISSCDIGTMPSLLCKEDMLIAARFFHNYIQPLQQLRLSIGLELGKIKEFDSNDISSRTAAVKSLYGECSYFFINNTNTGFIQRLMQECFDQLGFAFESDEYAIISLGSFALGTMTPWSDLEFAILVRFSEYKVYFRNFSKLLQIKLINLGETILPIVGVDALNNVRTGNEDDEWFWDGVTQRGFCLDGQRWYACKSPLGRQGGYKILKELNGESILIGIPDYELILTPDEMAEFQSIPPMGSSWFETDKHLVQALRFTSLIMGSNKLFNDYKEKLQHTISKEIMQSRALALLHEDVCRYSLKLETTQSAQLLNVKELYRLIDRVISALGNYFEIDTIAGNTGFTSWQILEQIMLKGKISESGKLHLDEALTIAAELRLHVYNHNSAQRDWFSVYPIVKDSVSQDDIFYFNQTHLLHHFYYIMVRLQTILQTHSGVAGITILETDLIFDDCILNKGKVHMRFAEYDHAKQYLEKAHVHEPKNLPILIDLFSLYTKMSNTTMARKAAADMLDLEKELLTQELDNQTLSSLSVSTLHEKYTDYFYNFTYTKDSFVNTQSMMIVGVDSEFHSYP